MGLDSPLLKTPGVREPAQLLRQHGCLLPINLLMARDKVGRLLQGIARNFPQSRFFTLGTAWEFFFFLMISSVSWPHQLTMTWKSPVLGLRGLAPDIQGLEFHPQEFHREGTSVFFLKPYPCRGRHRLPGLTWFTLHSYLLIYFFKITFLTWATSGSNLWEVKTFSWTCVCMHKEMRKEAWVFVLVLCFCSTC